MAEIRTINNPKVKRYNFLLKRLNELDEILAFKTCPDGSSLAKRAIKGEEFAQKRFEALMADHPYAFEEHELLSEEIQCLEDELGITDRFEAVLNNLDIEPATPEDLGMDPSVEIRRIK